MSAGQVMRVLCVTLVLAVSAVRAQSVPADYSADGLYNLANSYARAGKPAMAILNYERAALLAPDDADIEANLRTVRASVGLASEPPTWFERAVRVAPPASLAWCALIAVLVIGSSALASPWLARQRSLRRVAVFAGLTLLGLTIANGILEWPRLHCAVVLVAGASVRATPAPMGDALFALPEGDTVNLLGEHEEFVLVRNQAGAQGWVARASIASVVPSVKMN